MTTTVLTGNPSGSFVGQATYTDAGYPVTSASIKVQGQAILNDLTRLYARKTDPVTLTRAMRSPIIDAATGAAYQAGVATLTAVTGINTQAIEVPDGATITDVTMYIHPPTDGNLPGTYPSVQLKKKNITTGVQSNVSSVISDPNNTTGSYETVHGFGPTGMSEVVDASAYVYFVVMTGEDNPNATNVPLYGCTVTFDVTALDAGT